MWYHKINLWFTRQILLYNCCFSLLTLVFANSITDYYFTVGIFLTAGFLVGSLTQRTLHTREEYVFQNLAISNKQRYSFAYIFHIAIGILAALFIGLIQVLYA